MTDHEDILWMGREPDRPAPKLTGPPRPGRRMSGREVATVMIVMSLFVATGVGVILSSAEAASVALGIGLVVTAGGYLFGSKPTRSRR